MLRKSSKIFWLTAALLSAAACGDERPPTPGNGNGADAMPGTDAMPRPMADAFVPSDGPGDPQGPQVQLLSPEAPAPGDYSRDAIITSARFTVICLVTTNPGSGSPVDSSSVKIVAVGGDRSELEIAAQPTGEPGRYSARLNLGDFANGALTLRCEAADLAPEPHRSSDGITTYFDLGPTINVFVPMVEASYASQLELIFAVTPALVTAGDTTGSRVDSASVQAQVAGKTIPGLTASGDVFQTSFRFNAELFDRPLVGEQTLRVTASNARGVTRVQEVVFRVDSDGPTILVTTPTPGELVAGIMTVEAQITDPIGIEPTSVIATIGGADSTRQFPLLATSSDTYRGTFDTRTLDNMVYPTIVIRAQDTTGNQSAIGFVVSLDNQPPRVTMQSPRIREYKRNSAGDLECSFLFDPLYNATQDGQGVPQLSALRVRAEDMGNTASAVPETVFPVAGVDPGSVALLILDDTDNALVVDRNGDGYCDDVNPLLVPTSIPSTTNEIAQLDMTALAPAGQSIFGPGAGPYSTNGPDSICVDTPQPTMPAPLCDATFGTRIIAWDNDGSVPAIYAIPPAGDARCLGNAFDSVASGISDGWACVAVRAQDYLGNVGISPPLRICIDHDQDGAEGCPPYPATASLGALPDCRGTYDQATETVNAAATCWFSGEAGQPDATRTPLFVERELRRVR